jgi:hypothetical protein
MAGWNTSFNLHALLGIASHGCFIPYKIKKAARGGFQLTYHFFPQALNLYANVV